MTANTLPQSNRFRSIFSGSVGNLLEWYDWYAYSAMSLYFSSAFFPAGDQTAQLMNTAAVFAVGFLMRPIGGWLFGRYADRAGRRAALIRSVILMSVGSFLIAITPGYEQIGVWAPIALVFARLLQGLSVGGEYGTSATYLSEIATAKHRGFFASFQYVSLIMGQLLALGVLIVLQQLFLTKEQLYSWGWRIPFVIGAVGALCVLYLRRNMVESESFKSQTSSDQRKGHLTELLKYPRELLTVIGLTMGGTVAFYTYTTYMQKYLVNTAGFKADVATTINAITLFVFMLLQPLVGAISDRIGRRPVLLAFGLCGSLSTVFILRTLEHVHTATEAFFLIMAALCIVSGYTAINAVVKAELFPVHIRALGVGLPYAIAVSLFGGTAELIALWFKKHGIESGFYWYVTACIACSFITYVLMHDTKKHSMIDRP